MQIKKLQAKNDKELIEMKKNLELNRIRASCIWGTEKVKDKEAGINVKGTAKQGQKTKLQKQIRRTIAQINTLLQQRNSEELQNKHISKRKKRQLKIKDKRKAKPKSI